MATAVSSSSAAEKKRKRVVLAIEDKLNICDLVGSGRSLTSVAVGFNTAKSTIHDIVKNKAKYQAFLTEIQDGDCIKKRRIVRRANLEELDKAVYLWFFQQRCKGTPISGPLLMGKALQLYPLLYPNDPNPSSFKAGTGWLKRFKERHGVRALSVQGESRSAVTASIDPFKENLQNHWGEGPNLEPSVQLWRNWSVLEANAKQNCSLITGKGSQRFQ